MNKSADGLCLLVKVFGTEQRKKGKGRLRETTLCKVGTCRIIIHFFRRIFSECTEAVATSLIPHSYQFS